MRKKNEDSSNFCIECGNKLTKDLIKCSQCGNLNDANFNFCVDCGNDLKSSNIIDKYKIDEMNNTLDNLVQNKVDEVVNDMDYFEEYENLQETFKGSPINAWDAISNRNTKKKNNMNKAFVQLTVSTSSITSEMKKYIDAIQSGNQEEIEKLKPFPREMDIGIGKMDISELADKIDEIVESYKKN